MNEQQTQPSVQAKMVTKTISEVNRLKVEILSLKEQMIKNERDQVSRDVAEELNIDRAMIRNMNPQTGEVGYLVKVEPSNGQTNDG